MTLTINKGYNNDLKLEFVKQSIPLHNIKRISTETSVIEDKINIVSKDSKDCLSLIDTIKTFCNLEITTGNETNTVIVLWED